ncbi:MAG: hypothetical protein HQL32_02660 [Planctomycetes bacterium]|nr:hypothetical protein [Planctomycetota bacterium]
MQQIQRKVVTEKEIQKALRRAKASAQKNNLAYEDVIKTTKVRTKHPIKRIIVFIFGLVSTYFSITLFIAVNYLLGILFGLLSLFFFYVSFYGNRDQLSECILETGENALEAIGEIDLGL